MRCELCGGPISNHNMTGVCSANRECADEAHRRRRLLCGQASDEEKRPKYHQRPIPVDPFVQQVTEMNQRAVGHEIMWFMQDAIDRDPELEQLCQMNRTRSSRKRRRT